MKLTHLIPMEDMVLQECKNRFIQNRIELEDLERRMKKATNYAQFLKQKPELWMFVACDEGNVLQMPQPMEGDDGNWNYQARFNQYQQAKQKCLFEGFEVDEFSGLIKLERGDLHLCCNKYTPNKIVIIGTQNIPAPTLRTISDLCQFNLPLTQTAIDTIYN